MTDLLRFPDDETKAFRRARAERVMRAEYEARVVQSCVVLLNDCIAARPGRDGQFPALDLARWMTEANALLHEVKGQPAQIRLEARVAKLSLQLKGLVDEAELERFETVTVGDFRFATDTDLRAAIAEVTQNISGPGLSSLDMAREVNDELKARCESALKIVQGELADNPVLTIHGNGDVSLGRLRVPYWSQPTPPQIRKADLTLPQGEGGRGARRAPVAPVSPLTPDLISFDLQLPAGAPLASGETASAVIPPSSSVAAFAVHCLGYAGRLVAELRSTTSPVCALFHGATMPRLLRKVLEKGRGLFSRARGGA